MRITLLLEIDSEVCVGFLQILHQYKKKIEMNSVQIL